MAQILARVCGHGATVRRLIEAREKQRLASTLLFAGPSGVGKKLSALALTQALVCENPVASGACGLCGACLRIESGQSESLMVVEPDGANIKIEQAREILKFISLRKLGRARVVIIDQAHLLNLQAANALLKSLEEPPPDTFFILLAPVASAVLITIRSRTQMVRFRPLTAQELKSVLGPTVDDWVLTSACGSLEIAARLLDHREEFAELEVAVSAYLRVAFMAFPTVEVTQLKDLLKDRSGQSFAMGLLQRSLNQAMKRKLGVKVQQSPAAWEEIEQQFSALDIRELGQVAERALAMEQDLGRNIDRSLLLENFALTLGARRTNPEQTISRE